MMPLLSDIACEIFTIVNIFARQLEPPLPSAEQRVFTVDSSRDWTILAFFYFFLLSSITVATLDILLAVDL